MDYSHSLAAVDQRSAAVAAATAAAAAAARTNGSSPNTTMRFSRQLPPSRTALRVTLEVMFSGESWIAHNGPSVTRPMSRLLVNPL